MASPEILGVELVRLAMAGIPRQHASAEGTTHDRGAEVARGHDPAGHRGRGHDRAVLLLGFAGDFRRSELVALDVDDIDEEPRGLRIRIRRSKTDQEGDGRELGIPRGTTSKPVPLPPQTSEISLKSPQKVRLNYDESLWRKGRRGALA